MNSTFRVRWLASSEVISQVLFTSEQPTKNNVAFVGVIVTNKVALWAASYSACVVYTKTIIHLSVGGSGGYLPALRWIIVNYKFYVESLLVLENGAVMRTLKLRSRCIIIPAWSEFWEMAWQNKICFTILGYDIKMQLPIDLFQLHANNRRLNRNTN